MVSSPAIDVIPSLAEEHAARVARVRERMAQRSLAALVVTEPSNMHYLTGYDAWSFYTPQCVVVPADGEPVLFARAMDALGALRTATLSAEQVEGWPEDLVHRPGSHPFGWIAQRILDRGLVTPGEGVTVAVEIDGPYFSVREHQALVAGLAGVHVVDSEDLVNWVRVVKSPLELTFMRRAGAIAEAAMWAGLRALAPGARQCDVAAEILAAQARGTAEFGGDYPAAVPWLCVGADPATPHLAWTDEPFRDGDAVTIEIAGAYRRYQVPLARTAVVGHADPHLQNVAAAVGEGMTETLAVVTPGATAEEVHAAWDRVIRTHGLTKDSRIGYSIGVGYPPDWGERTVSLRPGDTTVLEPGMCLHVMLGIWAAGSGYEVSEPLIVTEDGAELLTGLPQRVLVAGEL